MKDKAKIFSDLERIAPVIPAPVFWMDKNCIGLGCNDLVLQAIGASESRELLIGKTPDEYLPKDIADVVIRNINQVIQEKRANTFEESIKDIKTGKIKYLLMARAPLFDDNGLDIVGTIVSATEITDRKENERLRAENEHQKSQLEQAEKIRAITRQVKHDITSPLASLKTLTRTLENVDEGTRITLRNVTDRINDIVNNLSLKYGKPGEAIIDTKVLAPEIISCLVDTILSEKRAQYSDYAINFELHIADDAQGLFAKVNSEQFKRVFSNIVNNAVEAIAKAKQSPGCINISLFKEINFIVMQIKDNGCGFPKVILEKIGVDKISTKGEEGHGIGLFTAVQQFKEWGGEYDVNSEEGVGVTFTVKLPIAAAPDWFQESIPVFPNSQIIILDDDPSIHNVWDTRLKPFRNKVKVQHFTTAESLLEKCSVGLRSQKALTNPTYISANKDEKCNNKNVSQQIFLIDYELLGAKYNGMEVIKKLHVSQNTFLVTSHYEEPNIKAACADLKIKIIPKNFAPYIPLQMIEDKTEGLVSEPASVTPQSSKNILPTENSEYILIDDDRVLAMTWKIVADKKGIKLTTFSSIADFEKEKHKFDKNTPIYVDHSLGNDNGLDYTEVLAAEGFTNLYLATGFDKSDFNDQPTSWLKGIVSKIAPFIENP